MTFTLSCPSNKSSYVLWITLYIVHVINMWYSSSVRFSLHTFHFFILDDDAMMLLQHPTRVRDFSKVVISMRSKVHGGSEMLLDMFWHFYFVLRPIVRINIFNVIFQFSYYGMFAHKIRGIVYIRNYFVCLLCMYIVVHNAHTYGIIVVHTYGIICVNSCASLNLVVK